MRTLVISDLHLGARSDVDVLRRPAAQNALLAALDGVDRLVVLGDLLELRHGPMYDALEAARPVLTAVGEALGPDGEVVLVPGNHDFRLVSPWLEWRSRNGPEPLGLQERAGPKASTGTRAIARMLQPASLDVVYPGIWLDDGVYATHGHYLDRHVTVPSFERLGAGVLGRLLGAPADGATLARRLRGRARADVRAARRDRRSACGDGRAAAPGNVSARAWQRLSPDGSATRGAHACVAGAFPLAIARAQPAGLGPLKADLSGAELRRANLRAMGEVVERLGIDARHVIFGHTHRSGPLPDDDAADWRVAGGAQLTQHRLLGLRVDVPRPPLGQPVLAGRRGRARRAAAIRTSCGCSRASTPTRSGPRQHHSRREAGRVAGHARTDLEVEHGVDVVVVLEEQVGAGPLHGDPLAVDVQLAGPAQHGPHRAGTVRSAVGAGLVGRLGRDRRRRARPRGAAAPTGSRSTPSSSWMASSVSA